MAQGTSDGAQLAARLGVSVLDLTVTAVEELSPSMLRVDLAGEGLVGLDYQPGQDLMLQFPTAAGGGRGSGGRTGSGGTGSGGRTGSDGTDSGGTGSGGTGGGTTRRRYTIRRLDPVAGTVELGFVRHGDGPAARWAAQAAPGMRLEGLGPRGKVTLDPEARGHILAGDETFIPAALSMAEAAPAGSAVRVVLEVQGAADELSGPRGLPGPADVEVRWVHRGGLAAGEPGGLVEALRALDWPPEPVAAYLGGERQVVLAMQEALVDRGLAVARIAGKAYWRRDMANADHGEPLQV